MANEKFEDWEFAIVKSLILEWAEGFPSRRDLVGIIENECLIRWWLYRARNAHLPLKAKKKYLRKIVNSCLVDDVRDLLTLKNRANLSSVDLPSDDLFRGVAPETGTTGFAIEAAKEHLTPLQMRICNLILAGNRPIDIERNTASNAA